MSINNPFEAGLDAAWNGLLGFK